MLNPATGLTIGDRAPDFTLPDQNGQPVSLRDLTAQGGWTALFFYPRDFTPGCTRQACAFRDAHADLAAQGVSVAGISADAVERHRQFAERHRLPYPVLSDPSGLVRRSFGIRKILGLIPPRVSLVIDPEQRVRMIYANLLDGPAHLTQVRRFIEARGQTN